MAECNQCGHLHPPLPAGQVCPMAKPKESAADTSSFIVQANSLIATALRDKNIKDPRKFFGAVIMNIKSFVDNYEE